MHLLSFITINYCILYMLLYITVYYCVLLYIIFNFSSSLHCQCSVILKVIVDILCSLLLPKTVLVERLTAYNLTTIDTFDEQLISSKSVTLVCSHILSVFVNFMFGYCFGLLLKKISIIHKIFTISSKNKVIF